MPKNNELVPKENAELTTFDYSVGLDLLSDLKSNEMIGLGELDASDIKMPKVKLLQPTSLEVTKGLASAGHYYNTLTKQSYETLSCILLFRGVTRVKWKDNFKRGDEPLCRSLDGKISVNGEICDSCPDSQWNNSPDAKAKAVCNRSYVWLGLSTEDGTPFRIIMSGMSVSPTKDFLSVLAMNRLEPFYFTTVLSSEFKENDKGSFYVAKYPDIKQSRTIIHDTLDSLGFTPDDIKNPEKAEIFLKERDKKISERKDIILSLKDLFFKAADKDTVDVSDAGDLNEPETEKSALF